MSDLRVVGIALVTSLLLFFVIVMRWQASRLAADGGSPEDLQTLRRRTRVVHYVVIAGVPVVLHVTGLLDSFAGTVLSVPWVARTLGPWTTLVMALLAGPIFVPLLAGQLAVLPTFREARGAEYTIPGLVGENARRYVFFLPLVGLFWTVENLPGGVAVGAALFPESWTGSATADATLAMVVGAIAAVPGFALYRWLGRRAVLTGDEYAADRVGTEAVERAIERLYDENRIPLALQRRDSWFARTPRAGSG